MSGLRYIDERLEKLRLLLEIINFIILEEAQANPELFSNLNREQLMNGIMGDGMMMPDYVIGSRQPSAPGPITLRDTGEFYDSIRPTLNIEGFEMMSNDVKAEFLVPIYNPLGIIEENRARIVEALRPGIRQRILKFIRNGSA